MPWLDSNFPDRDSMEDAFFVLPRVEDPLLVLRTMSTLREWGNRITGVAVVDARERGASWDEIAHALRRSRQSVHRQFAGKSGGYN